MVTVAIIGGGLAGHAAAHTVLQSTQDVSPPVRVVLLDKSAFCGGNSTKATSGINGAGTATQRRLNIPDTPETFEADTAKSAGQLARPALIRALTHGSAGAVEWLQDAFGLDLSIVNQLGAHSHPRTHRGTERFPGMAITYALMRTFEDICKTAPARAQLINKANVTRVLSDDSGRVCGVEYHHRKHGTQRLDCQAVVIATGGFGADFTDESLLSSVEQQWRQLPMWRDIPNLPSLRSLPTTNGPHCTGDGIKMATALGAGTLDMEYVQVHPTGLVDPSDPDAKVKWLAAEALRGCGALMVDADGRRFCNELGKRDYVSGCMFRSKGPFRLLLNSKASSDIAWHCEHYEGRGVMKRYQSAYELCKDTGVDPAVLQATFVKYNECAKRGSDEYGKKFFRNAPFEMQDSFYVSVVTPVVHYTMGGLSADEHARVLRKDGTPIPGLFAAGEVIGGIHGQNRLGGSSLLDCVVFGRLAGFSVTKQLGAATATSRQAPTSAQLSGAAASVASGSSSSVINARNSGGSSTAKKYSANEVAKHNTKNDCWVILHGKVYDVTDFLEDHPGGAASIVAYAGKDATKAFDMLHAMDILTKYASEYEIGDLADSSNGQQQDKPSSSSSSSSAANASSNQDSKSDGIPMAEVAKHTSSTDCWCVIHGQVYDLTTFLKDHPAGPAIILKYAGKDATAAFDASGHPKDIVSQLGLDHLCLGPVQGGGASTEPKPDETVEPGRAADIPPLEQILNLNELDAVAEKCLTSQGWAYYSSGADDEITLAENKRAFARLWLRPRILRNVAKVDISATVLGHKAAMPIYITATALGRLAHPEGEVVLTRAAAKLGVIQMLPTLASCTLEEMTAAAAPGQVQFFQLYVNHNRDVTRRLIQRAEAGGCKALFVTVDAPQLGRREKDMRNKFTLEGTSVQKAEDTKGKVDRSQGTARAISQFIDPSLNWDDLKWIRQCTSMPIILKGVQCAEDAILAVEHGVQGIVCSNHGGRQLDYARSGIEVLVEVMDALRERGLQDRLEVFVDGGIRRGTDVLKALCYGAKAVGIGRPCLYAMAGYGQAGVEHIFNLLRAEMEMGMRLIGATRLDQLSRDMVSNRSYFMTPKL